MGRRSRGRFQRRSVLGVPLNLGKDRLREVEKPAIQIPDLRKT